MSMAAAADNAPAVSDTRAPQTRRASRSRPNSSVPSVWPAESGGRRRLGVSTTSGSASGSHGASSAPSTAASSASAATTARRLRVASRPNARRRRAASAARGMVAVAAPASLITDARVEPGGEPADGEVHEDEGQRHHEHAALHQRKVAREDPLHHQRPHARPREDRLGGHGAPAQEAGRAADDGG